MDDISCDFLWMSVAPVRLKVEEAGGWSGSMGLTRMRSRVLSSVSMVRMVVLEGYVFGRVVDELASIFHRLVEWGWVASLPVSWG